MGYYLLDHPNVHARTYWAVRGIKDRSYFGYPSRISAIQGFVMHIPVALQDLTGSDPTAERVAKYFSTTDRPASAHVCIDADSIVECLPVSFTAFHAKDGNSAGIGIEHGWGHLDWGKNPGRDLEVLTLTAQWVAPLAETFQIPLRQVTRTDWLRGMKGFVPHSALDPARRSDPGPNYPWQTLFDLIRLEYYMDQLTQQEITFLKDLIAGVVEVGSNADSLKTLIVDFRERQAAP